MREAAEPGDDVPVPQRIIEKRCELILHSVRRFGSEPPKQLDRALLAGEILGMFQRQIAENPFIETALPVVSPGQPLLAEP